MRVSLSLAALSACACLAACGSSGSSGPSLQAASVIGPDGGLLVVQQGSLQGLQLEVPAGALAESTELRVLAVPAPPAGSGQSASSAPAVGPSFRIEPIELVASLSMRLRAPYVPGNVGQTGPGNVDVRQINPWTTRVYEPEAVDLVSEWVEVSVKTLGFFQVEVGEVTQDRGAYLPTVGDVASLAGGFQVEAGDEGPGSVYAGLGATHLEVTGPGVSERLVFVGDQLVGRAAALVWAEEWSQSVYPLVDPQAALSSMAPQTAQVTNYVSGTTVGATVMPLCYLQFSEPIAYQGALYTDVAKVVVNVAYDRADLGAGERRLTLWLSPDVGLLRLSVDGASYDRLP